MRDRASLFLIVEDVNTQQIYIFRQPHQGQYQEERKLEKTATVSLLAFPKITIAVQELFA